MLNPECSWVVKIVDSKEKAEDWKQKVLSGEIPFDKMGVDTGEPEWSEWRVE
jgi:hypothetical protein